MKSRSLCKDSVCHQCIELFSHQHYAAYNQNLSLQLTKILFVIIFYIPIKVKVNISCTISVSCLFQEGAKLMTNANIPGGLEHPYPDNIIILCLHIDLN